MEKMLGMKLNLENLKMKNYENDGNEVYKEVVVIGNGPSGIVVSRMLSGWLPYLVCEHHPDDMLAARLRGLVGKCLLNQDLEDLAQGLEGRSTNPYSLLLDALLHPCADIGLETKPLVELKKTGIEFDHVVLGKGPPGGSWHKMDPDILTLSLGSWMALPGLPFPECHAYEKRAYACDVARYYEEYVNKMNLGKYFRNNTIVESALSLKEKPTCPAFTRPAITKKDTWVKRKNSDEQTYQTHLAESIYEDSFCQTPSFITNAISCIFSKDHRALRASRCLKRASSYIHDVEVGGRKKLQNFFTPKHERKRTISCCCCGEIENYTTPSHVSQSVEYYKRPVPFYNQLNSENARWKVKARDLDTGETITYTCKYLVLACGANDMPNRLEILNNNNDPSWLVHDLRSLENLLDLRFLYRVIHVPMESETITEPVLIVGGGLSAADAIIAVRARNIPVAHVFRNKSAEFNKQLPENMYPEYHKVHQMMRDGGSSYPLYTAYPEYEVTGLEDDSNRVILTSKTGGIVKLNVSYAAVLIGSRPDLSFLPGSNSLAIRPDRPIDSKLNPVRVDPRTHEVQGYDGLFAVGPLAGDHFVRFIPGGALALTSSLYKENNLKC